MHECSNGQLYTNIEPNDLLQIKFEDKNRNKVIISRLRLGKCCTDEHLARMKLH